MLCSFCVITRQSFPLDDVLLFPNDRIQDSFCAITRQSFQFDDLARAALLDVEAAMNDCRENAGTGVRGALVSAQAPSTERRTSALGLTLRMPGASVPLHESECLVLFRWHFESRSV